MSREAKSPCMPDVREICRRNAELAAENARLRLRIALLTGEPMNRDTVGPEGKVPR